MIFCSVVSITESRVANVMPIGNTIEYIEYIEYMGNMVYIHTRNTLEYRFSTLEL